MQVVNKIKRFLIPSPLVSMCIFFPVHVDYSSKSRSCVQSFDSFKANEIELNVTNLARFRKKNIIVWRTLAKIVEKIKVTKLTYFITPLLHSSNPL